ncbi:nucleotide pyrophosphohydrolase [Paludibacterium paludis]|uniref:Nucleotide pyrophosphohydrolase n=1 Tax=Paludibacterium paludis TaxID=1225769 RepID=A0A918P1F6_9NEIS|nr:nucleotide pyrophosphohydrolase [Paludibacterium paludis]GGY12502.1 nucleotide pyrophosphohydrolase [Paludibacterium paludis]
MADYLVDAAPLSAALETFAGERGWEPYLTARNLMLALTGEVGELAEIFQWMSDEEAANLSADPETFAHLQEEIADVLFYLVQLARVTGVDLDLASRDKIRKNARKYPAPSQEA